MTRAYPSQTTDGPISILDMFKVGIGPSSSHTLGPWRAAQSFREKVLATVDDLDRVTITLHGSLAKTGRGHGTDVAVMLGLLGHDPVTCDVDRLAEYRDALRRDRAVPLSDERSIAFDPDLDIRYEWQNLPLHPNGMVFRATGPGESLASTFYSIGGGFIVDGDGRSEEDSDRPTLPYPIDRAGELMAWCDRSGMSIAEVVEANEAAWRPLKETHRRVGEIWGVMRDCAFRGCHTGGVLPGGLGVRRRAAATNRRLLGDVRYDGPDEWIDAVRSSATDFSRTVDWVSCFALAVNEENAAFGRVVTAPTNGAAGVIPAVLLYRMTFGDPVSERDISTFLYTASEVGSIFKKRATISAAMGGCQAEIGVSSSMAAAGLVAVSGGSVRQCLMAAEIAMEHHLGLTCDPIGGLVQVPCIERNAMGAIKAITAAQLALNGDPDGARVSLDVVVQTMWEPHSI